MNSLQGKSVLICLVSWCPQYIIPVQLNTLNKSTASSSSPLTRAQYSLIDTSTVSCSHQPLITREWCTQLCSKPKFPLHWLHDPGWDTRLLSQRPSWKYGGDNNIPTIVPSHEPKVYMDKYICLWNDFGTCEIRCEHDYIVISDSLNI